MADSRPRDLYRIGDLLLDALSGTLYRDGNPVRLSYRSAQLLAELARNHPNVVRRIDLIETLWPREDVTDQALSQRILLLRKELGDTARMPRYIGRVWGWGYHLVAPVERLPEDASLPRPEQAQALLPPAASGPPNRPREEKPLPRLAVLGFRNDSTDAGTNWLEAGLTEAVASDLARRGLVRVAPKQLVSSLLPSPPDLASSGDELCRAATLLGARWLVLGTYARVGTGLRIAPALFDETTSRLELLSKVEGNWQDLFSLQDRVVESLLRLMEAPTRDEPLRRRLAVPDSIAAFEEYALGRRQLLAGGEGALEEAKGHFERAVAKDPSYAMARSGLGSVLAMRYACRTDPRDLELAAESLRTALDLDPEITEPYPWLSCVLMRQGRSEEAIAMGLKGVELQPEYAFAPYFLGVAHLVRAERKPSDLAAALRHLHRAVEADPRMAPAWRALTCAALMGGDHDGAEGFNRRASEVEWQGPPLSPWSEADLLTGLILVRRGDFKGAAEAFRDVRFTLEGGALMCRETMVGLCVCGEGEAVCRLGRAEEALPLFRRAWQVTSEFPRMLGGQRIRLLAAAGLASAYALTGSTEKASELAREATQGLQAVGPDSWFGGAPKARIAYETAIAWTRIGNGPAATACLEAAVSSGWRDLEWLERDPALSDLRRRSGFLTLVSRASQPLGRANAGA